MFCLLPLLALAGFSSASTQVPQRDIAKNSACATAPKIPNMNCIDYTPPNGTQGALYIHSNATATTQHQQSGPGKQLQMAQFYPGDPGQAPITECGASLYQDGGPTPGAAAAEATGADCYALWAWAQANTGFWTLTPDNLRADPWTVFMLQGDCAFLMTTLDAQKPRWAIYVGNQDVATILGTAIGRFMDGQGKMEATGVANCPTSNGRGGEDKIATTWWIKSSVGILT